MAFANVNGINIHYEIRGSGPRLLFIHGIGADLNNPLGLFNSPLASQFTILAFDPRGLGESDSANVPFSIADMADDAAGLAAALGWDEYHLFGASMGGMVAQELVLRHPTPVKKLVMTVTHAGGEHGAPVVLENMWDLPTAEMLRLSDSRQDAAWMAANPELVRQMEQNFQAFREFMYSNPKALKGYSDQARAVAEHNTFDRLAQITVPTLVVGGKYDGGCPFEFTMAMAEQIPGARFELVDSGHGTWFFDPHVWAMISNFLTD
ncbi:MAG: alpha/beta hydrolase [Syntrophomonas sp.]